MIEAGLGGRYDATNVIPSKVQVLTSVGLEHTRWLGPTIADIAAREARRRPGGRDAGARRGAAPGCRGPSPRPSPPSAARGSCTPGVDPGVPVGAPGAFQRRNFALARAAAEAYLGELDPVALAQRGRVGARPRAPAGHRRAPADPARRRAQPRRDRGAGRVAGGDQAAGTTAWSPSSRSSTTRTRRGCWPGCCRSAMRSSSRAVRIPARCHRPPCSHWPASFTVHQPRWCADPRAALERARELAGPGGMVLATGSIYLVADLLAPEGRRRASML